MQFHFFLKLLHLHLFDSHLSTHGSQHKRKQLSTLNFTSFASAFALASLHNSSHEVSGGEKGEGGGELGDGGGGEGEGGGGEGDGGEGDDGEGDGGGDDGDGDGGGDGDAEGGGGEAGGDGDGDGAGSPYGTFGETVLWP